MTATRANALRLIAARADAVRIGISDETSSSLCAKIIAGGELDALRDELLNLLSRVAVELPTERGRLALWSAIAAIPDDECKPIEQRQASRLVLWHDPVSTARDPERRWNNDNVALDAQAVDEFNRTCDVINAFDRARETLIAIADVWLSVMPELTTADNIDWLAALVPAEQNEGS